MRYIPRWLIIFGLTLCVIVVFFTIQRRTSHAGLRNDGSLDSTTLDTGTIAGVQLNSILWHGDMPGGTSVGFQFATSSNSGGPWNYTGPNNDAMQYYLVQPGVPYTLPYGLNGVRYFRYRVTLISDDAQTLTPEVDDININWSP